MNLSFIAMCEETFIFGEPETFKVVKCSDTMLNVN